MSDFLAKAQVVNLAVVEEKKLKWLWQNHFPLGKISIIAGDPDVGKSFLTMDIAARVSSGSTWPDGSGNEEGKVLIMTAEDDLEDTVKPRLRKNGAKMENVIALQTIKYTDEKKGEEKIKLPSLIDNLDLIRDEIQKYDIRAVIIDPINAYLGGVNTHKDAEMRNKVFAPLKDMAEKENVAILCIMHLNKMDSSNAKHRVSGSIGYVAASRATWLIANDNECDQRKLMVPVKFNLGPRPKGKSYKIITDDSDMPFIEWEDGEIDITADELVGNKSSRSPARDKAIVFLETILSDGPVHQVKIEERAIDQGITERTLRRAKKEIDVKSRHDGEKWVWYLENATSI